MYAMFRCAQNLTTTRMAIYIDEHIGTTDTKEQETVFCYWYHMCRRKLYKSGVRGFSRRPDRADDFALLSATELYLRWARTDLPPIKSSMNFLNFKFNKLLSNFINYENKNCIKTYNEEHESNGENNKVDFYHANDWLHDNAHKFCSVESEVYINDLCKSIKNFVRMFPHKNDWELECIYTSCIFTLLSYTSPTVKKQRDEKSIHGFGDGDTSVERMCDHSVSDNVILFGLPENMRDTVYILVKEIIDMIVKELNYVTNSSVMESQLNSVLDTDDLICDEEN